jgi:hypothetical protein
MDHCIAAYVKHKKKELEFCACLTCKSGFIGDVMSAQGSRWLNTHSKKAECKKAHKDALTAFKECKGMVHPGPPAQPVSTSHSSIDDLWKRIKAMPDYTDVCIQKEEFAKEYDDSDLGKFVFDSAEGIVELLQDAVIYKKQIDKYKKALSHQQEQQEKSEIDSQNRIFELESLIDTMKYNINLTADEYRQRIETLEKELHGANITC